MPKDSMVNLNDREIKSIGWFIQPEEYNFIEVGDNGITKIDCAEQFCGDSSIYWFQVWKNEKIASRYNAKNVDSVIYKE